MYLGCVFAPLLLFFAISGIWQTLGIQTEFLQRISSIHTQAQWKDGSQLGSLPLRILVVLMALSFVATTVLGVVMAFKFGRSRKAAMICLALGAAIPLLLVLWPYLASAA